MFALFKKTKNICSYAPLVYGCSNTNKQYYVVYSLRITCRTPWVETVTYSCNLTQYVVTTLIREPNPNNCMYGDLFKHANMNNLAKN